MLGLFGVACNSLTYTYDKLQTWMKEQELRLKVVDMDKYPRTMPVEERLAIFHKEYAKRADVLFFDSMTQFRTYLPELQNKRVVVVLFAAPLQLAQVDGLLILDCAPRDDLSYIFKLSRLELMPIKNILRREKENRGKGKHIQVAIENLQHIPYLIELQKEGKLLHLFNLLVTRLTNHTNRTQIKTVLLHYLMGRSTIEEMQRNVAPYLPTRGSGKALFQDILNFLVSDAGKQLLKALAHINEQQTLQDKAKSKKKPINYQQIAKKYQVDRYELRYIVTAHRQNASINTAVRDAKTLASQYLKNYRQRQGTSAA